MSNSIEEKLKFEFSKNSLFDTDIHGLMSLYINENSDFENVFLSFLNSEFIKNKYNVSIEVEEENNIHICISSKEDSTGYFRGAGDQRLRFTKYEKYFSFDVTMFNPFKEERSMGSKSLWKSLQFDEKKNVFVYSIFFINRYTLDETSVPFEYTITYNLNDKSEKVSFDTENNKNYNNVLHFDCFSYIREVLEKNNSIKKEDFENLFELQYDIKFSELNDVFKVIVNSITNNEIKIKNEKLILKYLNSHI